MRFRPFQKIPLTMGDARSFKSWVATEKIHGAQLVIAVEGDVVRFGKRKDWLLPDAPFFGFQLVRNRLEHEVKRAASTLNAKQVFFYGELFGGHYPGQHASAFQPVQTGVWYCSEIDWAVFDILVADGDDDEGELLAFHELAEVGVRRVPLLRTGRYEDVVSTSFTFETGVPAWYGLPKLDGNVAEGIVLRPEQRMAPSMRPAVKHKMAAFDDPKFDESAAWDPGVLSKDKLHTVLEQLVTPVRLASVLHAAQNLPALRLSASR